MIGLSLRSESTLSKCFLSDKNKVKCANKSRDEGALNRQVHTKYEGG